MQSKWKGMTGIHGRAGKEDVLEESNHGMRCGYFLLHSVGECFPVHQIGLSMVAY